MWRPCFADLPDLERFGSDLLLFRTSKLTDDAPLEAPL
jgi:hypothetical protein